MDFKLGAGAVISLAGVIAIISAYEYFKKQFSDPTSAQNFATAHPNLASLAISLGFKDKTGHVPDVTGAAGAAATQEAFTAVVNDKSQGFYDSALQQYSYDMGLDKSLDGQGTAGWPWTSYQNWVGAGYPTLPTAGDVQVDAHGVYHNEYEV